MTLHISPDLQLPIDAVTETFAIEPDSEIGWALERLRRRTTIDGECWIWHGYVKNGYPSISIRNEDVYGHRLVCATVHGLEAGQEACHTCDRPRCWNPAHLFPGTRQENVNDAMAKGRASHPPRVTGETNHKAVLTDEEVAEVRAVADVPQRVLAAAFGCSQSTIWRIKHGKVRAIS